MDGLRDMVAARPRRRRSLAEGASSRSARPLPRGDAEDGGYLPPSRGGTSSTPALPETHDDGIARKSDGGVAAGTIVPRADDYLAPVCHHFGENHLPEGYDAEGGPAAGEAARKPCDLIGGCTLCDAEKVPFIDELDPEDNVNARLDARASCGRRAS
jgi:D-ornithine 4,5-aminomutase subunit beta